MLPENLSHQPPSPSTLVTQERLKDLLNNRMKAQGLTPSELVSISYQVTADQVKQKRSAFDRILKGKVTNPSLSNLERLVRALGGTIYIHWK